MDTLPKRKLFSAKDDDDSLDSGDRLNDDQVDENKCGVETESNDESKSTEQNTTVIQSNNEK